MNREDIKHIADIAQIEFTDKELDSFEKDFLETMDLIENIKKIDTKDVNEVFEVNGTLNNLREDEIKTSLTQEEATKNTKAEKYGYFKLLKFVE